MTEGNRSDKWRAKWIWTDEKLPPQNQYVYFRKAFSLTALPQSIKCHITAERYYRLWINGHAVGQGPALGHPEDKSYDTYDITKFLSSGKNVIAVLVHYDNLDPNLQGEPHFKLFIPETRAGLLCELREELGEGDNFILGTDQSWKTHRARAWRDDAPFLDDVTFQEHYTFGIDPEEWNRAIFNDKNWSFASVIGLADGSGSRGEKLPWKRLVRRDIPLLEYKRHVPKNLQSGEVIERFPEKNPAVSMSMEPILPLKKAMVEGEVNQLKSLESGFCLLENSDPSEPLWKFDGVHCATIIIDFGEVMNAYLRLKVEGEAGTFLDIGYGPNLLEGRVFPYRSGRTPWADRLILTDGSQSWRSFQWRQFRYVQITLRNANYPVKLNAVEAESVRYPYSASTKFSCSNKELEEFWKASQRTAILCTTDIFMDCASRERRQYSNDVTLLLRSTEALYGDVAICHRYLRQLYKAQLGDGYFLDSCPGKNNPSQSASESGFFNVISLWEHFRLFKEKDFLKELWPKVQRHLTFWEAIVNSQDLLEAERIPEGYGQIFYLDWSSIDRRGENLILNGLYLLSLRCAASMARILDQPKTENHYKKLVSVVQGRLKKDFWDEERGLFVDTLVHGKKSTMSNEFTQGIMLYLGLVTSKQAQRLVKTWMREPQTLAFAEVHGLYYVVEGLMRYGYVGFGLDLMRRRFRHFLREENKVFGEVWTSTATISGGSWRTRSGRAVAHGMGTWPSVFLFSHVVGLQPQCDKGGGLRLAPKIVVGKVDAEWCGIQVKWWKEVDQWYLEASFPKETPVELVSPFPIKKIARISINGKKIATVREVHHLAPCRQLEVNIKLR